MNLINKIWKKLFPYGIANRFSELVIFIASKFIDYEDANENLLENDKNITGLGDPYIKEESLADNSN